MVEISGTLREVRALLDAGATTSSGLVEASLSRADRVDERLGCFARLRPEGALADAGEADRALAEGGETSVLAGVPVGLHVLL